MLGFEYMNRCLYCMIDYYIVVYYLIVEVLAFLFIYIDYEELGRFVSNLVLDVVLCKFEFYLRPLMTLGWELVENPNGLNCVSQVVLIFLESCIGPSRLQKLVV
jgi:hypothetical protein